MSVTMSCHIPEVSTGLKCCPCPSSDQPPWKGGVLSPEHPPVLPVFQSRPPSPTLPGFSSLFSGALMVAAASRPWTGYFRASPK